MQSTLKEIGTREVYDFKLRKWVPYTSDSDKWYQYVLNLRDGNVQRENQGRYIVGYGAKNRQLKEMDPYRRK